MEPFEVVPPKGLDELIADLDSEDVGTQEVAVTSLRQFGNKGTKALPKLLELVKTNKNLEGRLGVTILFMDPSNKDAAGVVRKLLRDPNRDVRIAMLVDVAYLKSRAAQFVDEFEALLDDQDEEGRYWAACALYSLGDKAQKALDRLVKALDDNSPSVRAAVIKCLGYIGPQAQVAVPGLVKGLFEEWDEEEIPACAALALGKIGSRKEEVLLGLATCLHTTKNVYLRRSAAESLVKLGPAVAIVKKQLIQALSDEDVSVRADVAAALGNIGPDAADAIPLLQKAAKDEDEAVRTNAAEALKRIRKQRYERCSI